MINKKNVDSTAKYVHKAQELFSIKKVWKPAEFFRKMGIGVNSRSSVMTCLSDRIPIYEDFGEIGIL